MMSEKKKAKENTNGLSERDKQMKETELLYGADDQYGIYQLKDSPELDHLQFKGTWSLKKAGIIKENAEAVAIRPENYDLVYVGDMAELKAKTFGLDTTEDKLHALFEEFNIYRPADFTGHSLSVSDIVVLHENRQNSAHYVDSEGYTEMPHFIHGLEGMRGKEQDLAQDGREADRKVPEGRRPWKKSLRKNLEECKALSADDEKNQAAKRHNRETSR